MNKIMVLSLIIISLSSCNIDCKDATDAYRIYDIEVILTERPVIDGDMKFVGKKINSDEITTTRIMGRWYRDYKVCMLVRYTTIHRKEELAMYTHNRATTMFFKHICPGQVYEHRGNIPPRWPQHLAIAVLIRLRGFTIRAYKE